MINTTLAVDKPEFSRLENSFRNPEAENMVDALLKNDDGQVPAIYLNN